MSLASSLGKVFEISDNEKGYTTVIVALQVPWITEYKKFIVWKKTRLLNNGELFKLGDHVRVTYINSKFPKLKQMESLLLDSCPVCFAFYEVEDAQRGDCGNCSVDDEEKQERVNASLKLVSKKTKTYTYSDGCCLTFVDEEKDTAYFACVFKNKPFYSKLALLQTNGYYKVVGWITRTTDDGDFMIDIVDLPDVDGDM